MSLGPVHRFRHVPQLKTSVARSVQYGGASVVYGGHIVSPACGQLPVHWPLTQISFATQIFPHSPQFFASVEGFTHVEPQCRVPGAQVSVGGAAQMPFEQ